MKLCYIPILAFSLLAACNQSTNNSSVESQEVQSKNNIGLIDVVINATASVIDAKHIKINGSTNLPNNTELDVTVEDSKGQWRSQTKAVVIGGGFNISSLEISYGISPDNYKISITQLVPPFQPESVKKVIGDHGEYLTGQLVNDSTGMGKSASISIHLIQGMQSEISSAKSAEDSKVHKIEANIKDMISKGLAMEKYRAPQYLGISGKCGQLMRRYQREVSSIRAEADKLKPEYGYIGYAAMQLSFCTYCSDDADDACIRAKEAINNKRF